MVHGLLKRRKKMTQFYNQSDLEHLNEAQLRAKLSQIFNVLAGLQNSLQEYSLALATVEEVQKNLRRKLHNLRF
jgi:hypothetical protein